MENKITVELTDEEFAMINMCVEHISANERSFSPEEEKVLKRVAQLFGAEYKEECNNAC